MSQDLTHEQSDISKLGHISASLPKTGLLSNVSLVKWPRLTHGHKGPLGSTVGPIYLPLNLQYI